MLRQKLMIEEKNFNNRNHKNMLKTLWKETQKSKACFIIATDRNERIPKRKPAGEQQVTKSQRKVIERQTVLTSQRLSAQEEKLQTSCKLEMVQGTCEN